MHIHKCPDFNGTVMTAHHNKNEICGIKKNIE